MAKRLDSPSAALHRKSHIALPGLTFLVRVTWLTGAWTSLRAKPARTSSSVSSVQGSMSGTSEPAPDDVSSSSVPVAEGRVVADVAPVVADFDESSPPQAATDS